MSGWLRNLKSKQFFLCTVNCQFRQKIKAVSGRRRPIRGTSYQTQRFALNPRWRLIFVTEILKMTVSSSLLTLKKSIQ